MLGRGGLLSPPPHPLAPCKGSKTVLASGMQVVDLRIPGSRFPVLGHWSLDSGSNRQWGSEFLLSCFPNSKDQDSKTQIFRILNIPNAKISLFPESRFSYMGRPILHTQQQLTKHGGNGQYKVIAVNDCILPSGMQRSDTLHLNCFGLLRAELERV